MDAREDVLQMIDRARKAQKEFETYSQEAVDKAVRAVGKVVYDNAEPLARMAVDETGMGVYEHKIVKNGEARQCMAAFEARQVPRHH